jgi:hypothetical protein
MTVALAKETMLTALHRLDDHLSSPVTLIIGGGGAMILAHGFPLATSDIDAIPRQMELADLDPLVKLVARELGLPPDWLNPYFSSFTHTLPPDFEKRLVPVFSGRNLVGLALGKEEMLIMKCFAHRQKDVGHARALLKGGADREFVEAHVEGLREKGIPGAQAALDFLDDLEG